LDWNMAECFLDLASSFSKASARSTVSEHLGFLSGPLYDILQKAAIT
jgi:hypothetical protein